MIDVFAHRPLVDAILARYAIPPDWLDIVGDVRDACIALGFPDDSPFRAARCIYTNDRCYIVIASVLTDDMISGGRSRMLCTGFAQEVKALRDDRSYLAHLVLHEVATFRLQTSDQGLRDEWAFRELPAVL